MEEKPIYESEGIYLATERASSHFDREMISFKFLVVLCAAWRSSICIASFKDESLKGYRGIDSIPMLSEMLNDPSRTLPDLSRALRAAPRVPPGYEAYPEYDGVHNYYRLYNYLQNWHDAKTKCERDGAHLAIINSQAEADLFRHLIFADPTIENLVWLGFNDIKEEGEYVTVLGEPLANSGYNNWAHYQPDNYGNEDCGSMYPTGGLNDYPCHFWLPFLCEFPAT